MNIQNLKSDLHKQIDELQDAVALQLLHDAAVDYNNSTRPDILDYLSDTQKEKLAISLQQAVEGKTIPHDEALQLLFTWRNK